MKCGIFLILALYVGQTCCKNEDSSTVRKPSPPKEKAEAKKITGVAGFKSFLPKEIAVIGAGIAGLAAARKITSHRSNFTVHVYEARRERFGGRVWTDKLTNPRAKGPEVDLGGSALNMNNKNDPLVQLIEELELKTYTISDLQFHVPWENRVISGNDLGVITSETAKILEHAINASRTSKVEMSIKEAVDFVLDNGKLHLSDSASGHLMRCFPSYILGDYSTKNYQADRLDLGYDTLLVDGMGEFVDRLLSGSMSQTPLHLSLNMAVRQIKMDKEREKVVIRFMDGSQRTADAVVVAVPSTTISSGDIQFEPALPKDYQVAAGELAMAHGNKVLIQFEHVFWPKDIGVFVRAVETDGQRGHMQTWINVHRIVGVPVLSSFLTGKAAGAFEKLTDEEAQEAVLDVLIEMFGESVVSQGGKILRLQRSSWLSDPWSQGTGTYPRVGSSPALWDTFSEPLCPGIYFAGEHTAFAAHGTMHGAYLSGLRAASQIMGDVCEQRRIEAEERERKRREEAKEQGKDERPEAKDPNFATEEEIKDEL